jgi:hypothetical protein
MAGVAIPHAGHHSLGISEGVLLVRFPSS